MEFKRPWCRESMFIFSVQVHWNKHSFDEIERELTYTDKQQFQELHIAKLCQCRNSDLSAAIKKYKLNKLHQKLQINK